MRKDVYFCDVCERSKGEANHWFIAFYSESAGQITFQSWAVANDSLIKTADLHLCGAECVNKVVAKFLVGQKWK